MKSLKRVVAALTVVGMASGLAFAQPKDAAKPGQPPAKPAAPAAAKPAAAQPSDAEKAMMEAYKNAAAPGPMHAFLAKGVGTWDGVVKSFEDPSAPPKESTCISTVTSAFGGRHFRTEVTGAEMIPGFGPFQGFGVTGYDNVSKKFQYFWTDNMGTGFMTGTGDLSADQKTLTWMLTCTDPLTNKPSHIRQVDHYTGDNTFSMEMYGPGPDGKETKMMEISFTRKGGAAPAKPTK